MSTCSHPATPSIAAEPVSPLVAPTIVTRSFRLASTWSNIRADQLQRDVLERERRAVEQLLHPEPMIELHERRDGRVAERRVGLVAQLAQRRLVEVGFDERQHHLDRPVDVGPRPAGRDGRTQLSRAHPAVPGAPSLGQWSGT